MPIEHPWCIGVLDCTTSEASAAFGWVWDEVDEAGLGTVFYAPLAWDGTSRYLLSSSAEYPENGIAIDVSSSENAATARGDFLSELDLTPDAFLVISEGGVWFARWDPPQIAGQRPTTATTRPFNERRAPS